MQAQDQHWPFRFSPDSVQDNESLPVIQMSNSCKPVTNTKTNILCSVIDKFTLEEEKQRGVIYTIISIFHQMFHYWY